jgi:hypothetical protein
MSNRSIDEFLDLFFKSVNQSDYFNSEANAYELYDDESQVSLAIYTKKLSNLYKYLNFLILIYSFQVHFLKVH